MGSNDPPDTGERQPLSPKALTERIDEASVGDRLLFNDAQEPLEVVATDRYSVTLVDGQDNEYTVSQNLQTREWNVHQSLRWVRVMEDD